MLFKRSPLKTTRHAIHKRRVLMLKIAAIPAGVIVLAGLLAWVSRWRPFVLSEVVVSGTSVVDPGEIESFVRGELAGSSRLIFPRASKFLYPKGEIASDLLNAFPRLRVAKLESRGSRLEVKVAERVPAYLWCRGMPGGERASCYFLDEEGFVFSDAPSFSGNAYFTFYGYFYGYFDDAAPLRQWYVSRQDFAEIARLLKAAADAGVAADAFVIEGSDYSLHLASGGSVRFRKDQDLGVVADTIVALAEDTKLFSKKGASALEYVDLRFGNKIYYRLVGDNQVQNGE